MLGEKGLTRKRIARLRAHLRPGGDLVEATRALAWLLRARTAREELDFDRACRAADDARERTRGAA